MLGAIIGTNELYREKVFNWSGETAIPAIQKYFDGLPKAITDVLKVMSSMGGGLELVALVLVSFLLSDRPKCFYYITVFTIDKALIGILKLVYTWPRPLYAFDKVEARSCSREFGNPSGHSSSAWAFALVLFLDFFHGETLV